MTKQKIEPLPCAICKAKAFVAGQESIDRDGSIMKTYEDWLKSRGKE